MEHTDKEERAGKCPKCNEYNLDYTGEKNDDDIMIGYYYTCENCGFEGIEWSKITFVNHTTKNYDKITESK